MGREPFCQFGKEIAKRLVDIDRTQEWLMKEIRADTGLYVDTSYMHKIKTGKLSTPKIIASIRRILDIPEDTPPV